MEPIISLKGLSKTFPSGFQALKGIDLDIKRGEIFALLGPNGAGKTTLIGAVCGIVRPSDGEIKIDGRDTHDYRHVRGQIGLVPQELSVDIFERVIDTVKFSRGLFGLPPNPAYIEKILKDLTLWDKRNNKIIELSGGMKRRVMIAKALSHEPVILFLDEPTAGVDVELRRDMWNVVRSLREQGVTIILTTHYIEEAQEMADRIGVIDKGKIILVEDKTKLMQTLGQTRMTLGLGKAVKALPKAFDGREAKLSDDGETVTVILHGEAGDAEGGALIEALVKDGIGLKSVTTTRSSLEEIFVKLVEEA